MRVCMASGETSFDMVTVEEGGNQRQQKQHQPLSLARYSQLKFADDDALRPGQARSAAAKYRAGWTGVGRDEGSTRAGEQEQERQSQELQGGGGKGGRERAAEEEEEEGVELRREEKGETGSLGGRGRRVDERREESALEGGRGEGGGESN
jgi:hypothetical protein